jgi:hypothetical protein
MLDVAMTALEIPLNKAAPPGVVKASTLANDWIGLDQISPYCTFDAVHSFAISAIIDYYARALASLAVRA